MARNPMSVEYIMKSQKYLNILLLINEYSNPEYKKYREHVTMDHLRYKFLKYWRKSPINEDEMMIFFKETPFLKIKRGEYDKDLELGLINDEQYKMRINLLELEKKDSIDFSTDEKLIGDANLKKYIRNLKNFDLIKQKTVKKGKPYYVTTKKGTDKILRYMVERSFKLIPNGTGAMFEIFMHIVKIHMALKAKKTSKI